MLAAAHAAARRRRPRSEFGPIPGGGAVKRTTTLTAEPAFTSTELAERALHRRAVEAVIWGMSAVNYHLMYEEVVRKTKGSFNQVV
jgi:hypothetical protein